MNNINSKSQYIKERLSKKLFLAYNILLLDIIDKYDNNECEKSHPLNLFEELLNNFEEIEKIEELKDQNIFKFLYFMKRKVNKILYDSEKIIDFKYDNIQMDMHSCFYLDLMIDGNKDLLNYTFSKGFIKTINDLNNVNSDKVYRKIFLSKIIIELIKI